MIQNPHEKWQICTDFDFFWRLKTILGGLHMDAKSQQRIKDKTLISKDYFFAFGQFFLVFTA